MPLRKADSSQSSPTREQTLIQVQLSARQQRDVARYAENFGLEPASVVRQIQTRVGPAIDAEIAALTKRSEAYEKARADQERALRAKFLTTADDRHSHDGAVARSTPIALAESRSEAPSESASLVRTGT